MRTNTIIEIIREDITKIHADAIVNAANSSLLGGGGVDGAIHRVGGKAILDDCKRIRAKQGGCKTGQAVITTAGNLPARYVIHTVGPVWVDGSHNEKELLYQCYVNCLKIAVQNNIHTIAFPNISTGIYHFPKQLAAGIAIKAINDAMPMVKENGMEKILFVCFDAENYTIYTNLLNRNIQ